MCAAAGYCDVPCCAHPTAPEQLHLGPAADADAMSVSWSTLDATATHTVQYGLAGGPLNMTVFGTNDTCVPVPASEPIRHRWWPAALALARRMAHIANDVSRFIAGTRTWGGAASCTGQ